MSTTINKHLNPELWVKKYGDDLYAWACHRTGKKTVAEDLVQDTFLSALGSIDKFRGDSNEKTWLFSILKNKIIDHFRKAIVKYEKEESHFQHNDNDESFLSRFFDKHGSWNKDQRPANWHEEDINLLDDHEFRQILLMCMKNLPEDWLALINLKFLEERKTPEICKELGITPSNLYVIMHRAKLQLRVCIEENFMN
jgi:RNA polymerase sigma-70 factor (TIGR02943 family)